MDKAIFDKKFDRELLEKIAFNVRKYRILQELTQDYIADFIGTSREYYRKFESTLGSEGIKVTTLFKISLALKIDMNKFFE